MWKGAIFPFFQVIMSKKPSYFHFSKAYIQLPKHSASNHWSFVCPRCTSILKVEKPTNVLDIHPQWSQTASLLLKTHNCKVAIESAIESTRIGAYWTGHQEQRDHDTTIMKSIRDLTTSHLSDSGTEALFCADYCSIHSCRFPLFIGLVLGCFYLNSTVLVRLAVAR